MIAPSDGSHCPHKLFASGILKDITDAPAVTASSRYSALLYRVTASHCLGTNAFSLASVSG